MRTYTKPEIEISVFTTEDIITVSSVGTETAQLTVNESLTENALDTTYDNLF